MGYRGLLIAAFLASPGQVMAGNGGGDYSDHENPIEDTFQLDRIYIEQNGVTRQSKVVLGDGSQSATVIYDAPTDRVYLSNPEGAADAPLMEVAMAYSGGNLQVANAFADSIRQSTNSFGAFERTIGPSYEWRPPSSVGGACDMSPCGPGYYKPDVQVGDFSRYMGIRSFDYQDGWYELTYSPTFITQDKHYFEVWRRGECDDATTEDKNALVGVAGAVIACPAYETGLGAAGCGVAVAQVIRSLDHDDKHRNCKQSYPGPGRWGL